MALHTLRLTNNYAGIKANAAGTHTIDLDVTLKKSNEVISGTPKVNIAGATFSGEAASAITVSRGGIDIFNISPSTASNIDFSQTGMCDNVNNTSDIVIVITGKAQIYLELKKVAGYNTMLEPEQYGVYDDPAAEGS